jgi:TrmH family RNA methyltransferase
MITKNELKYYASLLQKKYRDEEQKFLVEGKKIASEALNSEFDCEVVFVTNDFCQNEPQLVKEIDKSNLRFELVKSNEIQKLSDTVTPQGIAAVFKMPLISKKQIESIKSKLVVCLEDISDPGNLGTIIRSCDWFGVTDIILSKNCVDVFNPKVIRSSMGSVFHLNLFRNADLLESFTQLKQNGYQLLLADIDGEDISKFTVPQKSVLILSNEANGPGNQVASSVDKKITITGNGKAESLNVANASAILLYALTTH